MYIELFYIDYLSYNFYGDYMEIFNRWEFFVILYLMASVLFSQEFKLANRHMKNAGSLTILLEIFTGLFSLLMIPFFETKFQINSSIILTLLVVVLIYAVTDRLNIEARYGLDPSTFSMMKQLSTVFMIIFGFVFLKEELIINKIVGTILIIVANLILTYNKGKFSINKYFVMTFFANFLFAVAMLINVDLSDHFNLAFYTYITVTIPAILIFILVAGFIILFVYIFIPVLYKQINDLINMLPSVFSNFTNLISKSLDKVDISGLDVGTLKKSIIESGQNMIVSITTKLPNSLISIVKSLISAVGIIALSLVIMIYMLMDFDNITFSFEKFLKKKGADDYVKLLNNIGYNARKVVNGTLLVAFMVFVCDTIGFAIVGLNAAVLFGLFCGITDLIPYIGPYIGGAAAVIVGFTQSPIIGFATLVVAIIVQLVESYVLQPVVMSKAMQLSPITIIVGLLLFGYFFGIVGMIIATPCMSIIKEIIIFISRKRKNTAY